jgi:hypothetical protein
MPVFMLKFFTNPKALLRAAALVLVLVLGLKIWGFVETSIDNAALVVEQDVIIQLKDGEIDTLQAALDQAAEAAAIAEEAEREIEVLEAELDAIRDRALNSGDDRDGPIAPVLSDTLRALRDRM